MHSHFQIHFLYPHTCHFKQIRLKDVYLRLRGKCLCLALHYIYTLCVDVTHFPSYIHMECSDVGYWERELYCIFTVGI